jgi:hypothetical protein
VGVRPSDAGEATVAVRNNIFLAHDMVGLHQMARGIGLGMWSAIAAFHQIATRRG